MTSLAVPAARIETGPVCPAGENNLANSDSCAYVKAEQQRIALASKSVAKRYSADPDTRLPPDALSLLAPEFYLRD